MFSSRHDKVWGREKILSTFDELNLRTPILYHWATETLWWAKHIFL